MQGTVSPLTNRWTSDVGGTVNFS